MDVRLTVFLTASGDNVVALAFLFELSVIEDECALRLHCLAVEGGERDVALVDVYANHSINGVGFGHVELACGRDV